MNIIYSSDENYARHMCVSMLSVICNNTDKEPINFYIFDNGIKDSTKSIIEEKCTKCSIQYIDFSIYAQRLEQEIDCPISISTYARLFIPELLPDSCARAIYLDCDTVVCGSLKDLWYLDLEDNYVGGVLDTLSPSNKMKIGLSEKDIYINAGVLLIDVDLWRKNNIQKEFTCFINCHGGNVFYQDQGVINAVLNNKKKVIHPRYNTMTPILTCNYDRFVGLYRFPEYYSRKVFNEAQKLPVILHFTPEYVGRVWEKGCIHPMKNKYIYYLNMTPWKGIFQEPRKESAKIKLLYWMMRTLPVRVLRLWGL